MKILLLSFFLVLNLFSQIFIQEASYTMGDDDSKLTAKNKAILIAKRDSIEQAGVYMSSYSKSINGILKDDVIESFSASMMKVTVLDTKFAYPEYWVKIQVDIDIDMLNEKIKQFNTQGIPVEEQIQSAQAQIEHSNRELNKLLQTKKKQRQLKELQERKKVLLQNLTSLKENNQLQHEVIKDKAYAYVDITSNIQNTEVYVDNVYVGIAPIKQLKISTKEEVSIKGVNDKRYYPHDFFLTQSYKALSTNKVHIELTQSYAEVFFIGQDNALVYVNNIIKNKLTPNNRVLTLPAQENTVITIQHKDGCYTTSENLWANNTYEIPYTLDQQACKGISTSFTHNGNPYNTMISPTTGKIWLDRNLGAKRACTSLEDEFCYGDYYQWGRKSDGHEKSNSDITYNTLDSTNPKHTMFVQNSDWISTQDSQLWKKQENNPCPNFFRVPTIDELLAEKDNALKLPYAGYRYRVSAKLNDANKAAYVWSSDSKESYSYLLYTDKKTFEKDDYPRANGCSVRCILDN